MAESSDDTAEVFDLKLAKHSLRMNFPSGKFKLIADKDRPDNMKRFKGPIIDITGLEAYEVVAVLSDIVNNKLGPSYPWENNKTFYLWIHSKNNPEEDLEELFRLKAARPLEDQPAWQWNCVSAPKREENG